MFDITDARCNREVHMLCVHSRIFTQMSKVLLSQDDSKSDLFMKDATINRLSLFRSICSTCLLNTMEICHTRNLISAQENKYA